MSYSFLPGFKPATDPPKRPFSFVRDALKAMPPPPTILMTPKQAAVKLGMSLTTFEAEVAAGKIGFVVISKPGAAKEHRRYARQHLDDYVKTNTAKETPKCLSTSKGKSIITTSKSSGSNFESQLDAKISAMQKKLSGNAKPKSSPSTKG